MPDLDPGDASRAPLAADLRRYKEALQRSGAILFRQDRDLRYTWVHTEAFGVTPTNILGRRDVDFLDEPAEAEVKARVKHEVMSTGVATRQEFPLTVRGETRYYEYTIAPWTNDDGRVLGVTGMAVDVTEMKRREDALRQGGQRAEVARAVARQAQADAEQARAEAEEARRLKSRFLAGVAHDLRSPLSVIDGYATLLAESLDGQNETFARHIEQAAGQLRQMATSLSELAQLDRADETIHTESHDVCALVAEAVEPLRERAHGAGLALEVDPCEGPAGADVSPSALRRIVDNLVGNAIKYTDTGRVTVAVSRRPNAVELSVADTGAGIPEAVRDVLFEPFTRGHGDEQDGTGLGLAVTKRLVDAMDGDVSVESGGDKGTTFRVTLPASS